MMKFFKGRKKKYYLQKFKK